jgi:photosystem II stability/assembly factor-like uncharacterized protein
MKSSQAVISTLLLATAAAPLSAGIDTWSRIGPPIGRVCALAAAPSRPSTVYALASGEIYKSTNSGRTWILLSDAGGDFVGCDLDVDPVDPETVYHISSFALSRSTDGGASWTRITLPVNHQLNELALHPARPGTIFLSGLDGFGRSPVLRSTDGGATWTSLSGPPGEIWVLAVAPGRPITVYAGTTYQGLFKSTNGGGSWAPANNGLDPAAGIVAIAIDPGNPRTLLVSTRNGVFRSTDGGASWVGSNQGLGSLSADEIAYDPARPATVYAGTGDGVFKSTDGGLSWSPANQGIAGRYVNRIQALPGTLLAGTYANGIYRSQNAAASWIPSSRGITGGAIVNLEIDPGGPPILFAIDPEAGLYRRVQGQGWSLSLLPESYMPGGLALDPVDPANVYVGLDQAIASSADSGATWTVHSGLTCTTAGWIRIDPRQPSTLYAGGLRSRSCDFPPSICLAWKSTDSGHTWSCLREGARVWGPGGGIGYWSYPQVQAFAVTSQGSSLYAILGGVLYSSPDGGVTWPEIGPINAWVLDFQVDPGNPSVLYIATGTGVLRSTDSGRTWRLLRQGFAARREIRVASLAIDPARTATLYAATAYGEVYKSTNSGETWRLIAPRPGLNVSVSKIEIDPLDPSRLYLGTNRGVMELTQSGRR